MLPPLSPPPGEAEPAPRPAPPPALPPLRRDTVALGRAGEGRARRFYEARGWAVVAQNVRVARVEVDLIVRRGDELLLVEVKTKRGDGFGDPLEMVDGRKLHRLRRAAAAWLADHPADARLDVAIEVLALRPGGVERVRDLG